MLIADDQPMLRAGLRAMFGEAGAISVVGEAADGVEAVELSRRLLPDVVVMASRLPRLDGPAATRAVTGSGLPVRVLVLTSEEGDEQLLAAVAAGAAGYLGKGVPAAELVAAVRAVAAGGAAVSPMALGRLLKHLAELLPAAEATPAAAPALSSLTEREREVLLHVARGHSNAEIAAALMVSETTVKTHVGHVLSKLRLRDRVQAVVLAYESGLVTPGNPLA